MAWTDQRDIAKQHLAEVTAALERANADPDVSRDVVAALTGPRAMSVALAKLAGVGIDEEPPTKR